MGGRRERHLKRELGAVVRLGAREDVADGHAVARLPRRHRGLDRAEVDEAGPRLAQEAERLDGAEGREDAEDLWIGGIARCE